MEYTEIVTLTKNGFQIPDKLLHPVGIYDQSRCWGTLIENVGKSIVPEKSNKAIKQILLSPIPFGSWGCVVRIQTRISDSPSMLAPLLRVLSPTSEEARDLGTNIITISGHSSGYYNARINILAELHDMRVLAETIKNNRDPQKLVDSSSYSLKIFQRMTKISTAIEESNKQNSFLYDPKVPSKSYLWEDGIIRNLIGSDQKITNTEKEQIIKYMEGSQVKSLSCEWLRTHALAYLYSKLDQPLRFDYSIQEGLLQSNNAVENSAKTIAEELDLDLPAIFLATFNPLSKYIRLVHVQHKESKQRLIGIRYRYECQSRIKDASIASNGSNGLLHYLTSNLGPKLESEPPSATRHFNLDIKNITSYSKRFNRRSETGEINILGVTTGSRDCNKLKNLQADIEQRIGKFSAETSENTFFKKDICVTYKSPYTIFLSCREEMKKDRIFSDICKRVAEKYGITFETSDGSAELVTSDVISKVNSVDALIVIFSITEGEKHEYMHTQDKTKFYPNLSWLLFEYGIGMGRTIPVAQLRDTTIITKEQWAVWVNVARDSTADFVDRQKPDILENKLEDAVLSILQKLASLDRQF